MKLEKTKKILSTVCCDSKNRQYSSLISQGYNSDFGQGNLGVSYLQARLNSTLSKTVAPSLVSSPKAFLNID
jgi:hypothetical protein